MPLHQQRGPHETHPISQDGGGLHCFLCAPLSKHFKKVLKKHLLVKVTHHKEGSSDLSHKFSTVP